MNTSSPTPQEFEQLLVGSMNQAYRQIGPPALTLIGCFIVIGAAATLLSDAPMGWSKLVVPAGVGLLFSLALWLAMHDRLSRGWTVVLGFSLASLPGLRMMVGALWDPLTPALYIYSPDVGVWAIIIVIVGVRLERALAQALGVWCGIQYLAAFWLSQPGLATLDGPPALIASLTSVEMAIVRALMFVLLGLIIGQKSAVLRDLVRGIVARLDWEERRATLNELARADAERLSEAKSAFLTNMSHELRSPLNAGSSHARKLLRRPELDPEIRASLQVIVDSHDHLCEMTNDLLDLSKIEAGRVQSEPKPIHVRSLVGEIAGLMRLRAQRAGLGLAFEVASDVPQWVRADPKHLRQVLLNLVGNALDYTEQGEVQVEVTRGAGVRFAVRDTGPGIADEALDEVFEPFARGDAAARSSRGVGLGLAISRELVQMMGSELELDSSVGRGSEFWFDVAAEIVEVGEVSTEAMPCPPTPELELLRELALDGNIKRLEHRLVDIEAREPRMAAFVRQLGSLARTFEDEAIIALLDGALQDQPSV